MQEHEPENWARVRHVLLPKDYVRFRLTDEYAVDVADGSGTILFDLKSRTWSPEVIEALGIAADLLPAAHEGPDVTGTVSADGAEATGLLAGTPVVAGGGDQSANAVGVGAIAPGVVALSLGTSGVVFATTDGPAVEPDRTGPCLLPCRSRSLAHDGRHAVGGRQSPMAAGCRRAQ